MVYDHVIFVCDGVAMKIGMNHHHGTFALTTERAQRDDWVQLSLKQKQFSKFSGDVWSWMKIMRMWD